MIMSNLNLKELFSSKIFHDQRWAIAEPSLARDGRNGIAMTIDGPPGIAITIDGPLGMPRPSVNCTGVPVRVESVSAF